MATVMVGNDGKAPKGLKAGDQVVTGGGTYTIDSVNADGTYKSTLTNAKQTTRNYNPMTTQTGSGPQIDYQSLVNNAAKTGNYQAAALYEKARNEKIAANPNTGYAQTYNYASYLPNVSLDYADGTDLQGLINKAIASGDYKTAAQLEQQRNFKLAKQGAGVGSMTQLYADHLNDSDQELEDFLKMQKEAERFANGSGAGTYQSQYADDITTLKNRLLEQTYESFKNSDEYKALEEKYLGLGDQAMNDAMAQVAARSGGLVSSYAEAAAQQQYQMYLQELETAALNAYNAKRAEDEQELARLQSLDDSAAAQFAQDQALEMQERQNTYNAYQQMLSDLTSQGMAKLNAGIMPSLAQLAAMGWTQADAQAYINSQLAGTAPMDAATANGTGKAESANGNNSTPKKTSLQFENGQNRSSEATGFGMLMQATQNIGNGTETYAQVKANIDTALSSGFITQREYERLVDEAQRQAMIKKEREDRRYTDERAYQ